MDAGTRKHGSNRKDGNHKDAGGRDFVACEDGGTCKDDSTCKDGVTCKDDSTCKDDGTCKDDSAYKDVSTAFSRAPLGLLAPLVRVEVHLGPGLPAFALVGQPEAVVRESKERVRSALLTTGFEFPTGRITVNLSPADLRKEGGRFDLPIAVGILAASGKIPARALEHREFYGELSLGGELRQAPKLLPALIEGSRAGRELILPFANALEAGLLPHAKLKLAGHLRQVYAALNGNAVLPSPTRPMRSNGAMGPLPVSKDAAGPATAADTPDLADVRG